MNMSQARQGHGEVNDLQSGCQVPQKRHTKRLRDRVSGTEEWGEPWEATLTGPSRGQGRGSSTGARSVEGVQPDGLRLLSQAPRSNPNFSFPALLFPPSAWSSGIFPRQSSPYTAAKFIFLKCLSVHIVPLLQSHGNSLPRSSHPGTLPPPAPFPVISLLISKSDHSRW